MHQKRMASYGRQRRCGSPQGSLMTALLALALLVGIALPASAAYFTDGFENYNVGHIDKNLAGGVNEAPNGTGNPWFGPCVWNNDVATDCARSGSNGFKSIAGGTGGWMIDYYNLAYRYNNGAAFTGNVYVDYWFYNPTQYNRQNFQDHLSLCYYPNMPANTDYPTNVTSCGTGNGTAAMGTATCEVWFGAPGSTTSTWNYCAGPVGNGTGTTIQRGPNGWKHVRIVVGPRDGSQRCPVSYYLDDMNTPVITATTSVTTRFNCIQLNCYRCGNVSPAYQAYYDDITFGGMPANPAAAAATPGVEEMTWNWTASSINAEGYKVYETASAVNPIGTVGADTLSYTETGLIANAPYTRYVSAWDGPFETARVAMTGYTLAPPPAYPDNIYTDADNSTVYTASTWPGFYNFYGFGTYGLVSKFKYKWSTSATDTLADGEGIDWLNSWQLMSMPPGGTYYIYFRSYNAQGVSNPTVLRMGPYHFTGGHAINLSNCQPAAGSVSGPASANAGQSVTVTATPNAGYSFVNWTRDNCGGTNVASTNESYTFTMPSSDVSLYANFKLDPVVTLVNCRPEGGMVEGSGSYKPGSSVAVYAYPNPGYTFVGWTTDACGGTTVASTEQYYGFTIGDTNVTLYANFVPDTIECIANSGTNYFSYGGFWNNSGNATCSSIACKYGPASPVGAYISVTPPAGIPGGFYEVQTKFTDFTGFNASTNIITTSEIVTGAVAVSGDMVTGTTANWQHANGGCNYKSLGIIKLDPGVTRPTLKWQYSSGTVDNNGNRWYLWGVQFVKRNPSEFSGLTVLAGPGGTASQSHPADPNGIAYYAAEPAVVTATPDTANGYIFGYWSDEYDNVVSTDNPCEYYLPYGNTTLKANFIPGCTVFASASPVAAGSVTGAGGYTCGTSVTLTAGANPGYTFSRWTSDSQGTVLVSTSNPYTFTISGNCTLYAQFTADPHTLTVESCANGTVTGAGVYGTAQTVTVVATPKQCYQFKNWTTDMCGGTAVVSTNQSYTFTMPAGDVTLYANFEPETIQYVRNVDTAYFHDNSSWYSGNATCGGISNRYQTATSAPWFSITPNLGATSGFYEVLTKFNDFSANPASANLVAGIALTDCVPVTGDMEAGATDKWQAAYGGHGTEICGTYQSQGIIKLSPGVAIPTIKWSYASGDYDSSTHRWYSWGVQFVRHEPSEFASLTATAGPGGTVSQSHAADPSGTGYYLPSYLATVTATPDTANGYRFENWTDGGGKVVSTDNPCIVEVQPGGVTLRANFAQTAVPVAKISDLWAKPNGPAYSLTGKTVTGVVGNAFWIEESDRHAAIKVIFDGTKPARDHSADVVGVLDSSSGQRVLVASSVVDRGAATPIKALGVIERAAAGKAVNADTPSIANSSGLYNVGLLVRIAGSASNANTGDPNNKYFYLDDGSGLTDGPVNGIKVLCGSVTPPSSGVVRVTGLVGVLAGKPVLVIRDSADIAP